MHLPRCNQQSDDERHEEQDDERGDELQRQRRGSVGNDKGPLHVADASPKSQQNP